MEVGRGRSQEAHRFPLSFPVWLRVTDLVTAEWLERQRPSVFWAGTWVLGREGHLGGAGPRPGASELLGAAARGSPHPLEPRTLPGNEIAKRLSLGWPPDSRGEEALDPRWRVSAHSPPRKDSTYDTRNTPSILNLHLARPPKPQPPSGPTGRDVWILGPGSVTHPCGGGLSRRDPRWARKA